MGGPGAQRVSRRAGEAGVQAADDLPLVAQQLGLEGRSRHPQVRLVEKVAREPGVAVQAVDHPGAGVRVERAAAEQRGGVLRERPFLDFGHQGPEIRRGSLRQRVQVAGGDGVGRQVDDVGKVVAGCELDRVELQDRGDQDDAVQVDVRALQVAGEHRRAGRAVALAEQVAGRVPAVVCAEEPPDELGKRLRVLVDAPVVGARSLAQRVAEAGAYGIDHHDVGDVEEGPGVVLERVGRRSLRADVGGHDAPRPHDPHVQPEGRGAGASVVGEHQGPLLRCRAVRPEVRRVPEMCGRSAVVVVELDSGDDGVVLDLLAADLDRVAGLPAARRNGRLGGHRFAVAVLRARRGRRGQGGDADQDKSRSGCGEQPEDGELHQVGVL